jgi:hypothetical protein
MADDSWESDPAARRLPLSWLGVLAVGWVLYELTTRPMVGVMAVCTKFGWEDFRAAIWLRRRDPWPYRGRACFWLYLASGLLKTSLAAFLMCIGFGVVRQRAAQQGGAKQAFVDALTGAAVANALGLVLAAVALGYALFLARRGHLRLWLGGAAHRARRRDRWPPGQWERSSFNGLKAVVVVVLVVVYVPVAFLAVPLALVVAGAAFGWPNGALLAPPLALGVIVGSIVGVVKCRNRVQKRFEASDPTQCWGVSGPDGDGTDAPGGVAAEQGHPVP